MDHEACTFERLVAPKVEVAGGSVLSATELLQAVLRDASCVQ
jgi:hypothetical protein